MLRRLDFAARRSNPVLMLIVIGLVVLNLSCFAALRLAHLPLSAPHLLGGTPAAAKAPLSLSR